MLDSDIRALQEAEQKLRADDIVRYKYDQYKKARKDWNSSILQANDDGRYEGKAEGKSEEAASIACNMLSKGVSIQRVHEYTKLPINKIEELQQQLAQA